MRAQGLREKIVLNTMKSIDFDSGKCFFGVKNFC